MNISKERMRARRKMRIRKKIFGTAERPRLVVYRSNNYFYAQLVDDSVGHTLAAASSLVMSNNDEKVSLNKETAAKVGREIARMAKDKNISRVVFDRNGYMYHGRVKALADAAREGGLEF